MVWEEPKYHLPAHWNKKPQVTFDPEEIKKIEEKEKQAKIKKLKNYESSEEEDFQHYEIVL